MQVKKGPVVFQDKMVLFLLIFLVLGHDAAAILFLYAAQGPAEGAEAVGVWFLRVLAIIAVLHLPVFICISPYRFVVWFRFTQDGIEYHTLFRRKKVLLYTNFPYLLHGKYLHGIYWRHYIIFADRRLKESQLNQINHVAPFDRLIKVQYSKKTYYALEAVLPVRLRASLTAIHWE